MYERKPVEDNLTEMPARQSLESLDIAEQKRLQLKQLFPEVFNEEKVDFERLQRVLGEQIDTGKERYGLTWPGKANCMKVIQEPSRATLKPCREESVDFDNTENLFIEGDNLEVLKLLQKSYFGKVKMIYIDPPYNTGNEFIYPDNYQESIETYLSYAGLVNDDGKAFSTIDKEEAKTGRLHSNWLSMMYPRLYLAKNLLREDGVIFISIDENEAQNLSRICDEIFGEDNAIIPFIWHLPRGINAGHISKAHEYILCYAKNKDLLRKFTRFGQIEESVERCNKKIDARHPAKEIHFPAGIPYEGVDQVLTGTIGGNESIEIIGKLVFKNGQLHEPATLKAGWTMYNMINDWLSGKEVLDTKGQKIAGFFFKQNGKLYSRKLLEFDSPKSVLVDTPDYQSGRKEMSSIFGSEDIFEYPKPSELIRRFIAYIVGENDICLDFFAGTAPVASAVMRQVAEDQKNRKYILVQLPEKCGKGDEAYKLGFETIANISKERIRRSAKKIAEETDSADQLDLGFQVYKLDKSHFGQWQSEVEPGNVAQLQANLELHSNHIAEDAEQEALLYELLLKAGFELTESIEQQTFAHQQAFSVAEGALLICLEDRIEPETLEAMVKAEPAEIIVKDSAFAGNDQLKVNAVQTVKAYNQNSETDIVFKVV